MWTFILGNWMYIFAALAVIIVLGYLKQWLFLAVVVGIFAIVSLYNVHVNQLLAANTVSVTKERDKYWSDREAKQEKDAADKYAKLEKDKKDQAEAFQRSLTSLEADRDKKLAAADKRLVVERATHGRLLDTARKTNREGCGSSQTEASPKAGLVERPTGDKEISPELENLLWSEFAAGERQIIQYERLQKYANTTYDICQGVN